MPFRYFRVIIIPVVVLLFLTACQIPVGVGPSSSNSGSVAVPVVVLNPTRGVAEFRDSDGSVTAVSSEEGGTTVECTGLIDFVIFDDTSSSARYSGGRFSSIRAVVLGVRGDGFTGIWVIMRNGTVVIPRNEENNSISYLQGFISEAGDNLCNNGWEYTAMEMAIGENGGIVAGTAVNNEAQWLEEVLGVTPQVAVWWNLRITNSGVVLLSRAKALAEYPDYRWISNRRGKGNWLYDYFGLWLFAWADSYLVSPLENDAIDCEEDGTYTIKGVGPAGERLNASIDGYRVLDIVPGSGNTPLNPVTGISPDTFKSGFSSSVQGTFLYKDEVADNVTVEIVSVTINQDIDESAFISAITILDKSTFYITNAPEGFGDYEAHLTIRVSDDTDSVESTLTLKMTGPG